MELWGVADESWTSHGRVWARTGGDGNRREFPKPADVPQCEDPVYTGVLLRISVDVTARQQLELCVEHEAPGGRASAREGRERQREGNGEGEEREQEKKGWE